MEKYYDYFQILAKDLRDTDYVTTDGMLKRQMIANKLSNLDISLLQIIENDKRLQFENNTLSSIQKLIRALRSSSYFKDSKTSYKNIISLATHRKNRDILLNNTDNVVLDYPYKDSVLVGDENESKTNIDEYLLNDIIDKPAIKDLFTNKILCNAKRYSANNIHGKQASTFDPNRDSLFLEGNNLVALHSLTDIYEGHVKSIIIDPPYYFRTNKSKQEFNYNSNFRLSNWLTFMKNRLEIAKKLLSDDGFLAITIGHDGSAYLKVLLDEIFDVSNHPKRYVGTITWRKDANQNNTGDFANVTDFILLYRKNSNTKLNRKPLAPTATKEYRYSDSNGRYRRSILLHKTRGKHRYSVTTPHGNILRGPWMISKSKFEYLKKHNMIYWASGKMETPYGKTYLKNTKKKGQVVNDLWTKTYIKNSKGKCTPVNLYGTNQEGKDEITELFHGHVFATPKPEKLLRMLIKMTTAPKDIVMDFFAGSATTQAVAMKMDRLFIGVEQMHSTCNKVAIPRILKVFNHKYDKVGIKNIYGRRSVFVYAQLMPRNLSVIQKIHKNKDDVNMLDKIYSNLLNVDNNVRLDARILKPRNKDKYNRLVSAKDKASFLVNMLDKSGLYYNYSDLDDQNIYNNLSKSDIEFNHDFYGGEK